MNTTHKSMYMLLIALLSLTYVFSNTTDDGFDPSTYTEDIDLVYEDNTNQESENFNFDPSAYRDEEDLSFEDNVDQESKNSNFDPSAYREEEIQEATPSISSSSSYLDTKESQQVMISEGFPERIIPLAIYGIVVILLIGALLLYSIHYYRNKHTSRNENNNNF